MNANSSELNALIASKNSSLREISKLQQKIADIEKQIQACALVEQMMIKIKIVMSEQGWAIFSIGSDDQKKIKDLHLDEKRIAEMLVEKINSSNFLKFSPSTPLDPMWAFTLYTEIRIIFNI